MQEVTSRRPAYVITRFGEDPPRLFEVTGANATAKRWHGRDVMTGQRQNVRWDEVIAEHFDLIVAADALKAATAALEAEDGEVRRTWLAYKAARRRRHHAVIAAARARVKA